MLLMFNEPVFNSPLDLEGLQLWLDASDTSSIAETANKVSQWNDKSGKGNHLTQATGAAQPLTNTNTINGRNVITFDNVDDLLENTSLTLNGDCTIFIAAKINSAPTFGYTTLLSFTDGTVSPAISADAGPSGAFYGYFNSQNMGATSAPKSTVDSVGKLAFYSVRLSDQVDYRFNLGEETYTDTYNGSLGVTGHFKLNGNRSDPSTTFLGCDVCEVIICNKRLTDADIAKVENYLRYRWIELPEILSPALWYDGSDTAQFTISAGKVTTITDKGTGASNASQANTAIQFTHDAARGVFGSIAAEGKMTFSTAGAKFIAMGFKFDFSQRASSDGGILIFNGQTGASTDRKPLIFYSTSGGNKIRIQWKDSGGTAFTIDFTEGTEFSAGDYLNLIIYDNSDGNLTATLNGTTKTASGWTYDEGTGSDQVGDYRTGWTKIEYSQIIAYTTTPNEENIGRIIGFIDNKSFT